MSGGDPQGPGQGTADAPVVWVIRGGEPTAEELAALVTALAVVQARRTDGAGSTERGDDATERRGSRWAQRSWLLRRPITPGPGAWRASGLPE